ncbi:hypothetical protein N8I77_005621 [Diaporthe amygdali]|uniref:Uncharacterized protein n=1 Tax=Phomopsis amygdali TaxID=1214568 RepID=A0AAD9SEB9_PHOAM|nr:hypothetical protein N8I77_005621 [Diaporthe amygdali]
MNMNPRPIKDDETVKCPMSEHTPTGEHLHEPNSGLNSIEARLLADAKSVPTPPASPSGQLPKEDEEIEIDISSSTVRLFTGRLYLALPNVRPPGLKEDEISDLIQHLETDLKAALGKIKAKSHRKPWKESSLIINMRMSGALEDGATKVKLKPCIWLFCGSRWCRKIIEKDLKKLNWRLPCGIQIVDKGGPLLAASEDSDEGFVNNDHSDDDASICLAGPSNASYSMPAFASWISNYAADFDTTGGSGHSEQISFAPPSSSSSSSRRSEEHVNVLAGRAPPSPPASFDSESEAHVSSQGYEGSVASSVPSRHSRRTDVNNTIHRQGRPAKTYFLPCEFAKLTGCQSEFYGDEEDDWIDHIEHHLRGILPKTLRCWYCVEYIFDADVTCHGSKRLNFELRMQHIRDHILFDGWAASCARPDSFLTKHLKVHRLVDNQTWHDLMTRNVVLSGPGCRAIHRRRCGSFSNKGIVAETSLKLLDGMILDFQVQESSTNSSVGLMCRSTIRSHRKIISERFSRMGGVITVTRALETMFFGVTSGHSLVCQILENSPRATGKPRRSFDRRSEFSASGEDSSSDDMSADNDSHSCDSPPSQEITDMWMNTNQDLLATFIGLRVGMVPRETSVMSKGMAGDLALIKLPSNCARRLQNQFVEPKETRSNSHEGMAPSSAVTEANDGGNKIFVLLGKTRSIAGSRVAGTFHFSVGGRKVETDRIMLSEDLGIEVLEYRKCVVARALYTIGLQHL